jgi:hypothetical protein
MDDLLVNKVANSGIITLDLETFLPKEAIVPFDLKDHLFMGLILKEKDFREALKHLDWTAWQNKHAAIFCSADAIIPLWAYMLVVTYLEPIAKQVYNGTPEEMYKHLVLKSIDAADTEAYRDQRVVVKGCGDKAIESYAYTAITYRLRPLARSIMYGEPCSTVPIYKKKL